MADKKKQSNTDALKQQPSNTKVTTRRSTRRSLETGTTTETSKIPKIQVEPKSVIKGTKDLQKSISKKTTPLKEKPGKPIPSEKKTPPVQLPPGYTPTRVPPGTTHARVQTPRSQVPGTVRPTKTPLNPRLRLPIFPRSPGTALPNPAVYFGRAQPGAPMYRTPISFPSPTLTNREELYRIYGPPSASCIQQAGELAKKVAQTQNGKRVQSLSDDSKSLGLTVTKNSDTLTKISSENKKRTSAALIDFDSSILTPQTVSTGDISNTDDVCIGDTSSPSNSEEDMLQQNKSKLGTPGTEQSPSDANKEKYYLVTAEMLQVFASDCIQSTKENLEPQKASEEISENPDHLSNESENQTKDEGKDEEKEGEVEKGEKKGKKEKKPISKKPKKKFIDKLCERTAKKTVGFYRQKIQYATGVEPSSLSNQGFYHQGTVMYGHFPPSNNYGQAVPGASYRPPPPPPPTLSGTSFGPPPPRTAYRLPAGAMNVLHPPGTSQVAHFSTTQVPSAFAGNTLVPVFPNNAHGPHSSNGSQLSTSYGNPGVFGEQAPVYVYPPGVNYGTNHSGSTYGPVPSGIFYGSIQQTPFQAPPSQAQTPQASSQSWPHPYGHPYYQ